MSSLDHPMDHPARAPLWAALVALIEAISTLLVPAGPGSLPITRPLRGRIRRALREAEGRLRRLLLPDAEAHLATLAPPGAPRPGRLAGPDSGPEAGPDRPPQGESRPRTVHPFRFRLHESCGNRLSEPADSPAGRASGPDTPDDPYGLEKVSARAEFARLARLVAAVGDPGPVIHRLALVLRRRAARALPRLPWHALWRPSDTLDLTPPFYPPPGLDPPPDRPGHVP